MAVGHVGVPDPPPVRQMEDGNVIVNVTGSSSGYGGAEQPIIVPTTFEVTNAVANLSKESEDGVKEIKIAYPPSGNNFLVEYKQVNPTDVWELAFNWLAVSD